jgi:hypothetical protein
MAAAATVSSLQETLRRLASEIDKSLVELHPGPASEGRLGSLEQTSRLPEPLYATFFSLENASRFTL